MLPTLWRLEVHGQVVPNVEAICRGVLNRRAKSLARPLTPSEYDDSLGYLLGEAAIQALRFEPRPGIELGPWLARMLSLRVIDHWRQVYGHQGQKRVVDIEALERARRDAGVEADGRTEQADGRLEARVEELVVGRVEISRIARPRRGAAREAPPAPSGP